MSRVGKKLIPLPKGVKLEIGEQTKVQGPKGTLTVPVPSGIRIEEGNGTLELKRDTDKQAAAHGLTRALLANAIQGVSTGFTRELDIVGTGYRVQAKGSDLEFALGFSHPVNVSAPEGISFEVQAPTRFVVRGIDKQKVGEVAANIRKLRKPEPYKGKGVRYQGENVRRKVGKAGK